MPERSTGPMMFIGERCAFEECHRDDFLPFKCSDCRQHYCSSHFRPQAHRCSHYDAHNADYRVPLCPICDNPPEGWKRDQDPNVAMDRHLSGQCPKLDRHGYLKPNATLPKATQIKRIKKTNECSFVKCSKIMVVPITCPQCSASFCPSHRAPNQHSCKHAPSSLSSPASPSSHLTPNVSAANGIKNAFQNLKISNPAAASNKPASTSKHAPSSNTTRPTDASNLSTTSAPFGKMFDKSEKRAKAERLSAVRAMQARQRKGILSKADEIKLAEEMAMLSKTDRMKASDSDCIVM